MRDFTKLASHEVLLREKEMKTKEGGRSEVDATYTYSYIGFVPMEFDFFFLINYV